MFGGGNFRSLQRFYYLGCQATQPQIIESPCARYAPQNRILSDAVDFQVPNTF